MTKKYEWQETAEKLISGLFPNNKNIGELFDDLLSGSDNSINELLDDLKDKYKNIAKSEEFQYANDMTPEELRALADKKEKNFNVKDILNNKWSIDKINSKKFLIFDDDKDKDYMIDVDNLIKALRHFYCISKSEDDRLLIKQIFEP